VGVHTIDLCANALISLMACGALFLKLTPCTRLCMWMVYSRAITSAMADRWVLPDGFFVLDDILRPDYVSVIDSRFPQACKREIRRRRTLDTSIVSAVDQRREEDVDLPFKVVMVGIPKFALQILGMCGRALASSPNSPKLARRDARANSLIARLKNKIPLLLARAPHLPYSNRWHPGESHMIGSNCVK
jgi:hypothetical protein